MGGTVLSRCPAQIRFRNGPILKTDLCTPRTKDSAPWSPTVPNATVPQIQAKPKPKPKPKPKMSEQVCLFDLNRDFTGRDHPTFPGGYHPARLYRLHRRQRAEVWKHEHRAMLLESILHRRYIPPIITHEVVDNGRVHRDILDGGNRISAMRRILEGGEFELTEDNRRAVERYTITVVVLRGLSPQEIRIQFRLLNRVVRVSPGHLYHMSAEDSPLVTYAYDIMTNPQNPLRPRILELFTENALKDNASKGALENVIALCAGAQHGVPHITRSFDINEPILGLPVNPELIETRVGLACTAIARANALMPAGWTPDGRIMRGEFNIGRYLAVILYDLLPHGTPGAPGYEPAPSNLDAVLDKWARIIAEARQDIPGSQAKLAVVDSARSTGTSSGRRKVSKQVDFYLAHRRMPTDTELAELVRVVAPGADPEETEEESDEEDV